MISISICWALVIVLFAIDREEQPNDATSRTEATQQSSISIHRSFPRHYDA